MSAVPEIAGARYERAFDTTAPPERCWLALVEPRDIEAWLAPEVVESDPRVGGALRWVMSGHPQNAEFVQLEEPWRLAFVVHDDVCRFALEPRAGGGTHVMIESGGTAARPWPELAPNVATGWDQCVADLIALLDYEVRLSRHGFRNWLGVRVKPHPIGLEALGAAPGTWAERVGVAPGDLLLQIGRAPLFSVQDVWNVGRTADPGDELELLALRDGALLRLAAPL